MKCSTIVMNESQSDCYFTVRHEQTCRSQYWNRSFHSFIHLMSVTMKHIRSKGVADAMII